MECSHPAGTENDLRGGIASACRVGSEILHPKVNRTAARQGRKLMQQFDYDEVLDLILAKDDRYPREAYHFVREGLDYTQHKMTRMSGVTEPQHVSGQELTDGMRQFALETYGPMAKMLLNEWGILGTTDFGEIVFNLVENNLLAKTEKDTREDFAGGFDFEEAFTAPYEPLAEPKKKSAKSPKAKRSK